MWKNIVQPNSPQMTIWRMRVSSWVSKATNTHSQYVILTVFPLQNWLKERASKLRYTYIACIYLNIKQLDALNIIMSVFHASTCFEHMCSTSGRANLYYTASDIITLCRWPSGAQVERVLSQPVHGTATYRCDDTRCCIIQFWPPDDEHIVLETCTGV